MYIFKITKQAISKIVPEICAALIKVLEENVKMPITAKELKTAANYFNMLWNFPRCVGVMDDKPVAVVAPKNSSSEFSNYKSYFSIVLFGVIDAKYNFLFFNIDCQGRISDNG